jgi:glucose/mannose-6-phosphate isomerase
LKEKLWELDESIRVLEELRSEAVGSVKNSFIKKIAVELEGYTPLIYGPPLHKSIIKRISTEFNLNSKLLSSSGCFPEVFRNGVMVMESSRDNLKRIGLIIVRDPEQEKLYMNNLVGIKMLASERLGKVVEIDSRGKGQLSRMLSVLYIGDFLSYYLAMLYGKDPSSVETVRALKIVNQ